MARLGYERYGTQGGDWGSIVSTWHAFKHPEQVAGLHLNMVVAQPPAGVEDPTAGVPAEELQRSQARLSFYNTDENGYAQIQGTKPQTVGYGLNDSPAGQAAWIVEKFRAWCDCNGDPESIFTRDELLTNVMIYWVTQTATSSARLYYEAGGATTGLGRVEVPTGAAIFPYELFIAPRAWAEAGYNITHWTEMRAAGTSRPWSNRSSSSRICATSSDGPLTLPDRPLTRGPDAGRLAGNRGPRAGCPTRLRRRRRMTTPGRTAAADAHVRHPARRAVLPFVACCALAWVCSAPTPPPAARCKPGLPPAAVAGAEVGGPVAVSTFANVTRDRRTTGSARASRRRWRPTSAPPD